MIRRLNTEYGYRGANLYKNLSVNYRKMLNTQQAIFYLRDGLDYYPDDVDFYVRLASISIDLRDQQTALQYVQNGKNVLKGQYDKRLDILRVKALALTDTNMSEQELLSLREQGLTNAEYYFKLIEHYVSNNRFIDAKRELDTVSVLDLNEVQTNVLNVYKLYFALKMNDIPNINRYSEIVLQQPLDSPIAVFNHAVLRMMNGDYDRAINILVTADRSSFGTDYKAKLSYLIAVCYYMKRDFGSSYKYAKATLALKPSYSKASYLMSLIAE